MRRPSTALFLAPFLLLAAIPAAAGIIWEPGLASASTTSRPDATWAPAGVGLAPGGLMAEAGARTHAEGIPGIPGPGGIRYFDAVATAAATRRFEVVDAPGGEWVTIDLDWLATIASWPGTESSASILVRLLDGSGNRILDESRSFEPPFGSTFGLPLSHILAGALGTFLLAEGTYTLGGFMTASGRYLSENSTSGGATVRSELEVSARVAAGPVVPEPAGAVLAGCGLAGLLLGGPGRRR